jgi:hypothetical protein
MTCSQLEDRLSTGTRELVRQLLQDHMDLRAEHEERLAGVTSADGAVHSAVEAGHERPLATVFGQVAVRRRAYRHLGQANLYPADAALNLPTELYSHNLRRHAAEEAARGSFHEAVAAVERACGQHVPKRQLEELVRRSAADFDRYYASAERQEASPGDVVVMSADGKGIVVRSEALRPATAAAATSEEGATRLSKGAKRYRRRMAEIGVVYVATPAARTPEDVMGSDEDLGGRERSPGPVARAKWLTASVADDAADVIAEVFAEADRRDPRHERAWVALVDGNRHQIDVIKKQAKKRKVKVTIVCDFVHVLQYLFGAASCFFPAGSPAAEAWVKEKALEVLRSRASVVAGSITRKATRLGLDKDQREDADTCAKYLLAKSKYLDYATALEKGWPIATGVVEGACRHLVKDRMDITGARWGLRGAEAVLKLRALRSNGDFSSYWAYHLAQEQERVHKSRYFNGVLPRAA